MSATMGAEVEIVMQREQNLSIIVAKEWKSLSNRDGELLTSGNCSSNVVSTCKYALLNKIAVLQS